MYSVVIRHKQGGKAAVQVPVSLRGQNYTPTPAEYHSLAWRVATDDQLIEVDADKDDYSFEIVNISMRDALSQRR